MTSSTSVTHAQSSSDAERSAERELAMILDKSSDNIVVTDGDGTILKASSNFNRIYGLPISEAVGKNVQELQASGILTPSVTLEVLKRRRDVQLMQSTSQGFQVMALGFPIFDDAGEIERVISFSRDLTDLQLLQQEYEQLQQRLLQPLLDTQQSEELAGLAFKSRPVREIIQLIRRIADTEVSVLFQGESGVGKTAFARLIHQLSDRKEKPFVEVNCSAIPENLFESEMFGYEAGAFSGASRQGKSGLIASAEGGTLFLDEVGELPQAMQAKLLKVLQDGEYTPVGSVKPRKARFRLITATNRQLSDMVEDGLFRLDLYYRVNVVPVYIPSLRERSEDIPVLAGHILSRLNRKYQQQKQLPMHLQARLQQMPWPGNIRELENTIERWFVSSEGEMIRAIELEGRFEVQAGSESQSEELSGDAAEQSNTDNISAPQSLKVILDQAERQALEQAIQHCRSSYQLAEYLQISQPSAVRKLKKHGLTVTR